MYTRVRLGRPFRHGAIVVRTLDYCLGRQADRATTIHVRGVAAPDVVFAGCLILSEGRDEPVGDLKTYGQLGGASALAAAVEACLAERTSVIRNEVIRISGQEPKRH